MNLFVHLLKAIYILPLTLLTKAMWYTILSHRSCLIVPATVHCCVIMVSVIYYIQDMDTNLKHIIIPLHPTEREI